jgi:hypothetical protein
MQEQDTQYIQGYIVLDDYADPIKAQYKLYHDKQDALSAAKIRLQQILLLEDQRENYGKLVAQLDFEHEAHIEGVRGGWQGDSALIRITELYT